MFSKRLRNLFLKQKDLIMDLQKTEEIFLICLSTVRMRNQRINFNFQLGSNRMYPYERYESISCPQLWVKQQNGNLEKSLLLSKIVYAIFTIFKKKKRIILAIHHIFGFLNNPQKKQKTNQSRYKKENCCINRSVQSTFSLISFLCILTHSLNLIRSKAEKEKKKTTNKK